MAALTAFLVAANASGAPRESRPTILAELRRRSRRRRRRARPARRRTPPARVSRSESSASRIALARPTEAATVAVAPPSGISPILVKASVSAADSVATTRSQASAVDMPTPAAIPLSAAHHRLVELGDRPDQHVGAVDGAGVVVLLRVLPAEVGARRERGARSRSARRPVRRRATTAPRSCSISAITISPVSALNCSGRFRVSQSAPSSSADLEVAHADAPAYRSRSLPLTSLPVGVRGRSSVTMNSRGTLKCAIRSRAYAVSSAARSSPASAAGCDERHHALPHVVVGHADHGDVEHRRVQAEQVLDLLRVDVHAAADDHERLAVGEEQVALVVEVAEVADGRPERVLGVPGGRRLLRVVVVGERLVVALEVDRPDLARPAARRRPGRTSAGCPSRDRPTVPGVRQPVLGSDVGGAVGLGARVVLVHDRPEPLHHLLLDLDRARRRRVHDASSGSRCRTTPARPRAA